MTLAPPDPFDSGANRRRHPRVPLHVRVDVFAPVKVTLVSDDLSRSGAYLRWDSPLELGTLLDLKIRLPHSGRNLVAQGAVTHALDPEFAAVLERPPGMGVRFLVLDGPGASDFASFLHQATSQATQSGTFPSFASPEVYEILEPLRRAHPRTPVRMPCILEQRGHEVRVQTVDVSIGGVRVAEAPLEVGMKLNAGFIRPNGSLLREPTVVVRAHTSGTALAFEDMSFDAQLRRKMAFEPRFPPLRRATIALDDPRLA